MSVAQLQGRVDAGAASRSAGRHRAASDPAPGAFAQRAATGSAAGANVPSRVGTHRAHARGHGVLPRPGQRVHRVTATGVLLLGTTASAVAVAAVQPGDIGPATQPPSGGPQASGAPPMQSAQNDPTHGVRWEAFGLGKTESSQVPAEQSPSVSTDAETVGLAHAGEDTAAHRDNAHQSRPHPSQAQRSTPARHNPGAPDTPHHDQGAAGPPRPPEVAPARSLDTSRHGPSRHGGPTSSSSADHPVFIPPDIDAGHVTSPRHARTRPHRADRAQEWRRYLDAVSEARPHTPPRHEQRPDAGPTDRSRAARTTPTTGSGGKHRAEYEVVAPLHVPGQDPVDEHVDPAESQEHSGRAEPGQRPGGDLG